MNSCELVAYVSTIACALAKNLPDDELSLIAAVFSQLGDTLTTIITHEELCNPKE